MTSLLHITPQLPPAVCGVGDYATTVGGRMEEQGLRCGYVAAGWRSLSGSATERQVALWEAIEAAFEPLGEDQPATGETAIVLHYSGYGYSPDGAPAWLAEALENRPDKWLNTRVVTFFHELYASGMPWQRAFWQSSRQRRVAERIARASDALITNREPSARWLESVSDRLPGSVPHLPVPSNVGEPEAVPAYEDRPPHAVLFGSVRHKKPFLVGRGARRTAEACRQLGITRLTDIGTPSPLHRQPFDKAGVEVVQTGYLAKEEVSRLLLEARVGFAKYNPAFREKSGVLAAFSSHGVLEYHPHGPKAPYATYTGSHRHAATLGQLATKQSRTPDGIAEFGYELQCELGCHK